MKINTLTSLRFFAAVVVVIFHYGKELTFLPNIFFQGPEMVTFFFVLSGLVLTIAYHNRPPRSTFDFLASRLSRIAPIYFIALSAVISGKIIQHEFDITEAVFSVLFVQSWIPGYALTLNSPGWSISVEMFFYAIFPFIFFWAHKSTPSTTTLFAIPIALIAITLACEIKLSPDLIELENWTSYFPLLHLASFILGIAGGFLLVKSSYHIQALAGIFPLLASALLCITLLEMSDEIQRNHNNINMAGPILSPVFLLLILCVASNTKHLSILQSRPLVLLGEASYSLYILQLPVSGLVYMALGPNIENKVIIFLIYLVTLIATSVATYTLIEKPIQQKIKRIRTKPLLQEQLANEQ